MTVRFSVEDSSNCGGSNRNTQQGTAVATLKLGYEYDFTLALRGKGEGQDPGYERMTVTVNGNLAISAESAGGGFGCPATDITPTEHMSQPIRLPAGTHTIELLFTTSDGSYHQNAFYEAELGVTQV